MSTKKQHFVPCIYMTAWKYKLKHLSNRKKFDRIKKEKI